MQIPQRLLGLSVLLLALLASCESRRSAYRLPKPQGRSASGSPSPQDVGSGRDFMKKFMMMRGMFQQPPSDNVIIITQAPTTTTTTTTAGSPSTTTTTTTAPTSNTTGRSSDGPMPEEPAVQDAGLEDRLDLPEAEPLVVKEAKKPKFQKRFRVKNLQLNAKRSHAKQKPLRRVHRHHKKNRGQKKTQPTSMAVNQQKNSESPASSVNFIEPYQQTSQSGSDSRLQRIWRRFQIAN